MTSSTLHPTPAPVSYAEHERVVLEVIAERDRAENMADQLADAIATLTGVDIGEHSNVNDPWLNALAATGGALARIAEERRAVPAERPAAGSAVPAEGSGQRCPSRIAHESGAVHRCDLRSGHDGMHEVRLTGFFAEGTAGGSGHPQPAPTAAVRLREIASDPQQCREWLRSHGLGDAGPGAVLLAAAADLAEGDTDV